MKIISILLLVNLVSCSIYSGEAKKSVKHRGAQTRLESSQAASDNMMENMIK